MKENRKILIIDNDADSAQRLWNVLNNVGYQLECALSSEAGEDVYLTHMTEPEADEIDVVIIKPTIDVVGDGIFLAKKIKEASEGNVRIIMSVLEEHEEDVLNSPYVDSSVIRPYDVSNKKWLERTFRSIEGVLANG